MKLDTHIFIPVSLGELVDKITILEIKCKKIDDHVSLSNVQKELSLLNDAMLKLDLVFDQNFLVDLREVNEKLWDVEDAIRDCEKEQLFGSEFVNLARSIYKLNDRRSRIKRELNEVFGSQLIEEKCYR